MLKIRSLMHVGDFTAKTLVVATIGLSFLPYVAYYYASNDFDL